MTPAGSAVVERSGASGGGLGGNSESKAQKGGAIKTRINKVAGVFGLLKKEGWGKPRGQGRNTFEKYGLYGRKTGIIFIWV